jgi:cysteine-rich repeat protein
MKQTDSMMQGVRLRVRASRWPWVHWVLVSGLLACAWTSAGCTDCLGLEIPIPVPACGDGMLDTSAGEQCDEGGDTAACDRDCTPAVCGDGRYNPAANEQCDEGGETATCDHDCTLPACGDGYINTAAGEACDGMSATCDHDCTAATCGDGAFNPLAGEACDDGNADDGDGCVAQCQWPRCGDGLVQTGSEACDDGNTDDTDACTTWCEAAACPDGLRNGGETDLDCGGSCDVRCGVGQGCAGDGDCASGTCSRGRCVASRLAAGYSHTCALLEGGGVRCWGANWSGQLGYGHTDAIGDDETPDSVAPVDVGGRVVEIAAGAWHTCALLEDGGVRCWGANRGGQLGYGHTDAIGDDETPGSVSPVDVGGRVVEIAAGFMHTCALREDGAVRCWGVNWDGQLGYGHTRLIGDDETPGSVSPVDVGGRAVEIAAGAWHTCALLEDGAVRCWGENDVGELGYGHWYQVGDDEAPASAGDVNVGGRVVALAAGASYTCALLEDGAVRCWGGNWHGRLGYGPVSNIGDDEVPASAGDVEVGARAVDLVAGGEHTCALLEDGAVRCWGGNWEGQLGLGHENTIGDSELPTSEPVVDVGGHAVEIAAGEQHTCALLEGGAVRCWGSNGAGQLGYGHTRTIGDTELPAEVDPVPYR